MRAVVIGARRTAEELGRAFPSVPIRMSGRDGVLARVGPESALVVSTPGAEPVADEGYAAALLMLDGWALLGRADLRAGEETLRRWFNAAALTSPGAPVIVLADSRVPAVQALIRWDPVTFAERELAERRGARFPARGRMARLTGRLPQAIGSRGSGELPDGRGARPGRGRWTIRSGPWCAPRRVRGPRSPGHSRPRSVPAAPGR